MGPASRLAGSLLFLAAAAWGLDPSKSVEQYDSASWTTQQGLPHNQVNAIAQTSDGYLWIATPAGLARFDGVRFTIFLSSDDITGLAPGRDGSLWIQRAPSGLSRLRRGRLESWPGPVSRPGMAEDPQGALWLATDAGLCRFEKSVFRTFAPGRPERVLWVTGAPDGTVWFGARSGLGQVREGKVFTLRTRRRFLDEQVPWAPGDNTAAGSDLRLIVDPQPALQPGLRVRLADGGYTDASGCLYLGVEGGFPQFGKNLLWMNAAPQLRGHRLTALLGDHDGGVWLGMRGLGLRRFHSGVFREAPLFAEHEITALFEDREGSVWIGTREAGLFRLSEAEVTRIPLGGSAQTLLEDSAGRLWAGVRNRVLRYEQGRWDDLGKGLQGLPARSLAETPDGSVWLGTQDGFLHQFSGNRWRHYWLSGDPGPITALCAGPDGRLWIGAGGSGLASWRNGQFERYKVGQVRALAEGRGGEIWIGTSDRGLNLLQAGKVRQIAGQSITALHLDGTGTLWIGTNGAGLGRLEGDRLRFYGRHQGLPDDTILALAEQDGAIWAASRRGLFRVRKKDLDSSPVRCRIYDDQPAGALWPGARGRLWFTTERGVAFVEAGERTRTSAPPSALLEELVLNGQPFDPAVSATVTPGPGELRFTYTAPGRRDAGRLRFRYQLAGFDRVWRNAGTLREAQYTNIPPGRYQFQVAACSPEGACGLAAEFGFELRPRFYQTLWFPALCAGAFGALLWGAYRIRMRLLRRQFAAVLAERNRIAVELHDGLLQNLTGIVGVLDAAGTQILEAPGTAKQGLDRARFLVRDCLAQARRAVWNIREQAPAPDDFAKALRRLGADEVAIQGTARPLEAPVREEVLAIAREAVANARKHAGAGLVRIDAAYSARCLRLSVQDDGRGFDPAIAPPETCFGIRGMRERAARIGADFQLRSAPGRGCEVVVCLSI